VQEIAAAAFSEIGTAGRDPIRRRVNDVFNLRVNNVLRVTENSNFARFAHESAFDKDDTALLMGDAVSLGGIPLDGNLQYRVFLEFNHKMYQADLKKDSSLKKNPFS
jgi:hypothetical protein